MTPRLRFDFEGRTLRFERPLDVLEARTLDAVVPALAAVDAAARAGRWVAGYVAYDAAPAFDDALAVRPAGAAPLLWFGVFDAPRRADLPLSGAPGQGIAPPRGATAVPAFESDTTPADYGAAVAAIRAAIGRGDVYQVNYTMLLRAAAGADAFDYPALLRGQEPGYGALLELGDTRILSLSPELFFRRRGRQIETRPMKGTARRGRWLEEDEAAAARLAASEKERAENLMIVDLMRNDLGRVARFGSVHVPRLFEIERYPTVHQMTSSIAATLRDGVTLPALFAALFPCGSVTGAPKVAAMRAIAALERAPRGVYCGAIGVVEPGGDCTFSVAIRTLRVDRAGVAEYGVGGGITWDSNVAAEHDEALAKAAVLAERRPEFELLETMRVEDGRLLRLERHLARLADSARYFGFGVDAPRIAAALVAATAGYAGQGRVRLRVQRDGEPHVAVTPLAADPGRAPLRAVLAARPVSSRDVFLFHKTTHRATYDARRAAHPDADDVLLHNERGELTEFTTGNLVLELDALRLTPPRAAGLLAGVFREAALEAGELIERTLTRRELERASRCWLINSVRGWVPVTLPLGRLGGGGCNAGAIARNSGVTVDGVIPGGEA